MERSDWVERAQARGHAYQLFSRLFREELTEELASYARALPGLEALNPPGLDQAAADHYRLFGYNVFPYESAFLQPEFHLGGQVAGGVGAFYQEIGFPASGWSEPVDHIGLELGALAFLSGAEADAWEDGLQVEAGRMAALALRFLDEHLLRWLPGLALAVQQQAGPDGSAGGAPAYFGYLADLANELAIEHRRSLALDWDAGWYAEAESASSEVLGFSGGLGGDFPGQGALSLEDTRTGLKEIAGYLLAPARSGFYLSRDDISRLARGRDLPRGFGGRHQMLTNLLRTAANYDELGAVIDGLARLARAWQAAYAVQLEAAGDLLALAAICTGWHERLAETLAILDRLERAVHRDAATAQGSFETGG